MPSLSRWPISQLVNPFYLCSSSFVSLLLSRSFLFLLSMITARNLTPEETRFLRAAGDSFVYSKIGGFFFFMYLPYNFHQPILVFVPYFVGDGVLGSPLKAESYVPRTCPASSAFLAPAPYSAALKLYIGLTILTISAASPISDIISSIGLYANGASSMVLRFTVLE